MTRKPWTPKHDLFILLIWGAVIALLIVDRL